MVDRRDVLTTVGSALTLSGSSYIGSAVAKERTYADVFAQARRIRNKTGSQERFHEYLRNNSGKVANIKTKRTIPSEKTGDDDGFSSQKLEEANDITTHDLTLTEEVYCDGSSTVFADYRIDIDTDVYHYGEKGPDTLVLSCDDGEYEVNDYSWYTENADNVSHSKKRRNYCSFEHKDKASCGVAVSGCNLWFAVGCSLDPQPTDATRSVYARYVHTWDQATVSGISIASDGFPTFTIDLAQYSWEGGYDTVDEGDYDYDSEYSC